MKTELPAGIVDSHMVGAGGSAVAPGRDQALYGTAALEPLCSVEARSYQTFTLTYTVGRLGLDDTGAIGVCFRVMSDFGPLQTHTPDAANYVSATCSGEGRICLSYDSDGGQRPWNKRLTARLEGGYLKENDTIQIVFGDTSAGSPGWAMQTFAEEAFEFRVIADVVATRHFEPLSRQLAVPVIPGPPDRWVAVLPTLRRPDEPFQLGLKAEDRWGNPTDQADAVFRLEASLDVTGLPDVLEYKKGQRSFVIEGLSVSQPGVLRIRIMEGGRQVAEAGPLVIRGGDKSGYWGDLHGQSGETVGVGRAEKYFDFARNLSFLDATSHQGNDFQINPDFWDALNDITARYDEPGRFVAIPGYEWSGNTAIGGDHNVFFRYEGREMRRSSHALIRDEGTSETDAFTLTDLYQALEDEDCVLYAHVGGRYANIHYDHNPILETAFELHSAWGSFEWMLTDAFDLGYRVGVVCNSDGHKGRPGASYPGSSTFGAYGGLTCFLSHELSRDGIFDAMRARHHYGTTGIRMHLDVAAEFETPATLYEKNPQAVPDTATIEVDTAMMGDIVHTDANEVRIKVSVEAAAPIERIEIRNGPQTRVCHEPFAREALGQRIRVQWTGAEYRGRGRNTHWKGRADFGNASIEGFARFNLWNPERMLVQRGRNQVVWDTVTTGNFTGFDVWLSESGTETLDIRTNHGNLSCKLSDLSDRRVEMDAGGLGRALTVRRLPDHNPHRSLSFETDVTLDRDGDNPVWVCVTTEDGHQAWSSPIYFIRRPS